MSAPEYEEKPIPLWQKITAVFYVIIIAGALYFFRNRLSADFIPFDASRVAPNILAEVVTIVAVTPVAVLFWPPVKRRIHGFVTKHTTPLHDHFEEIKAQAQKHHEEKLEQAEQHHQEQLEKLDKIHKHLLDSQ